MTSFQQLQKRLAELDRLDRARVSEETYRRGLSPAGTLSNAAIQRRNGGARPKFINSIGGDSSNYR